MKIAKCLSAPFLVDRSVYLMFLGVIGLFGSLFFEWYVIPDWQCSTQLECQYVANHSWIGTGLKGVTASCLVLGLWLIWRQKSLLAAKLFWVMLAILLAYPLMMLLHEPDMYMKSQLIYRGMNRVVSEIDNNHIRHFYQFRWHQTMQLGITNNRSSDIFPVVLLVDSLHLLPQKSTLLLSDFLGVSNEWLAFVNRGLVLAVVSILLSLMGIYLSQKQGAMYLRIGGGVFIISALMITLLLLLPWASTQKLWFLSSEKAADNQFQVAVAGFQQALQDQPTLTYSIQSVAEYGAALHHNECRSCLETRIYQAYAQMLNRRRNLASGELSRILEGKDPNLISKLRLYKGFPLWMGALLNEKAETLFNAGYLSLAIETWQASLAWFPENPVPWYGMGLANIKLLRFSEAIAAMEQLVELQTYLGFQSLAVPAQLNIYKLWFAMVNDQHSQSHQAYLHWMNP